MILHEEGNWKLHPTTQPRIATIQSFILHTCPTGKSYYWYDGNMDDACYHCGEYVASGVLGLWKLHNFDWLGSVK